MTERSRFNPIPEGEPGYNPIGTFSFGSMGTQYNLEGCRRCGAAVPADEGYQDRHDEFHLAIDKLYEWASAREAGAA